jgi:hypothetical protein
MSRRPAQGHAIDLIGPGLLARWFPRWRSVRLVVDPRLPPPCTGVTAQWCPNHGTCACPDRARAMDDQACPLHRFDSPHATVGEVAG